MKKYVDGFKTKRGFLTVYALACGYIECSPQDQHKVKLFMHAGCRHFTLRVESPASENLIEFYDFHDIVSARKAYLLQLKRFNLKRNH